MASHRHPAPGNMANEQAAAQNLRRLSHDETLDEALCPYACMPVCPVSVEPRGGASW